MSVIQSLCDHIRTIDDLQALEDFWATLRREAQDDGELRAAYDYRKACLSSPIDQYLGAG